MKNLPLSILLAGSMLISILTINGCYVPPPGAYVPPPRVRHSLYRYHYYPYAEVYFDNSRGLYFYLSDNVWLSAPVLPPHIHIDIDNYISLELDSPRPYIHHRDTVRRYPRGIKKKQREKKHAVPPRFSRHRYRYYPRSQVYFDSDRRLYFYLSDNVWLSAPVLPPHFRIDIDNYVTVELDDPKPYIRHRETLRRFPPGLIKEKNQQKIERQLEKRERKLERKEERREKRLVPQEVERERRGFRSFEKQVEPPIDMPDQRRERVERKDKRRELSEEKKEKSLDRREERRKVKKERKEEKETRKKNKEEEDISQEAPRKKGFGSRSWR